MTNAPPFEEIEHTADLAFRARGCDLPELFANAARAMTALEGATAADGPELTRDIEVEGVDRDTLLVNWLNELLYLEQSGKESYDQFEFSKLTDQQLRARVRGRRARQNALRRIKAVTFHGLEVKQTREGWEATVVVDV